MKPEMLDKFAEALITLRKTVEEIVANVPVNELPTIAADLRKEAEPNSSCSFPMPDYARLAELVEYTYHMRVHFDRAKSLGCRVYCVAHSGDMKDCAHLHDD